MLRNLACAGRWLALGLLTTALPACLQSIPTGHPPAIEATHDNIPLEHLDSAVQERRRLLAELGVEAWHQERGKGRQVKVAILDSGFRDYRKCLGNRLPSKVSVRSFRKDGNLEARDSQHGILCAEVLHALAPDAEMLFANWEPDSPQAFLEAVRWAKSEGAKILSCSLIIPSWSDGEGGGEVHRVLNEMIGNSSKANDLLFFASAGNTAERHWHGTYDANDAGWHRWRNDDVANALKPWGRERVAVELYGAMRSAYELSVWHVAQAEDGDSADLVGKSVVRVDSTGSCGRAVVRFEPDPSATYEVRVRCMEATDEGKPEAFHLVVLGGRLQHTVGKGSIPFPGDGASVIAVGAVDGKLRRLSYSSCGPNSVLPKPDFVATVPFPSLYRKLPFAGTSAAAPQAAGLAALLWSQHADWTGSRVVQAMRDEALDLGPPGHDWEHGHGLIRLPR